MDVTWHIRHAAGGSNVAIDHDFVRPLPLIGTELFPRLVDRFFYDRSPAERWPRSSVWPKPGEP